MPNTSLLCVFICVCAFAVEFRSEILYKHELELMRATSKDPRLDGDIQKLFKHEHRCFEVFAEVQAGLPK